MRAEQVDYGYTIQQAGDGHVISYQQKLRLWQVTLATLAMLIPVGWICSAILNAVGWILQLGNPLNIPIPLIVIPLSLALSIVAARAIVRYIASLQPPPTISISPQVLEATGNPTSAGT
jgi:hypothetical protein